ncbi:MAG: hypothetical protein EOO28_15930 [Comamonadaceae bacterium]|nr:MAG: hypothetical protein EOO28_15930 [Comamonadaceae bacterium]
MDTTGWDALLHALYETALAPGTLPATMEQCARWVGADTYHLLSFDAQGGAPLLSVTSPQSADAEQKYLSYYAARDPRLDVLDTRAVGELAACQLEFKPHFVSGSEIWQDLLIPCGARFTAGGVLRRDGGVKTVVGFHRPASRGPYSDDELQRTKALMPHMSRTSRLMGETAGLKDALHAARQGTDAHADGTFLLARSGRMLWANAAAEALLREGTGLRLAGGRLAAGSTARMRMRDLYTRVLADGRPVSLRLTTATTGMSAFDALYLTVLRMTGAALATDMAQGWSGKLDSAALMVMAHRPASRAATPAALEQLFGLTRAEAGLAAQLAQGKTVDDYAADQGLQAPTVRTHLRAIYAKTGVSRLQDLQRLLGGMRLPT